MTTRRQLEWAGTMRGAAEPGGLVIAHRNGTAPALEPRVASRHVREELEDLTLAGGATRAHGAGSRLLAEEPDPFRTCFERDRDRILHSAAFRRLAGKTQVFVFPADHQRTRLTHALEVAQVATAVSRAVGLNVDLTEAIALGHDCGHGPGGHASEDAFDAYLDGGFHHAPWGADVALNELNLCAETLDGVRNHSWSRPAPSTPEGAVVSWSDRYAYCAHDLEDAVGAGIVTANDLPRSVSAVLGSDRSTQLQVLITALVDAIVRTGTIGLDERHAEALADLRAFNYEHIYNRPASVEQGRSVVRILRSLVDYFIENPAPLQREQSQSEDSIVHSAVAYVAGMTDRFAFATGVRLLGWAVDQLPVGIDIPVRSCG